MIWPLAVMWTVLAAPAALGFNPDPTAGWHGREIREPLPPDAAIAGRAWPRGWSAGAVGLGAGYALAGGSRRVRELQRRLHARGYRTGRVDGRLGPRTRAALTWFQVKHGLKQTGAADVATVTTLRARPRRSKDTAPAIDERKLPPAPPRAQRSPAHTALPLLAALALLGCLAAIAAWIRAELRRARHHDIAGPPGQEPHAPAWDAPPPDGAPDPRATIPPVAEPPDRRLTVVPPPVPEPERDPQRPGVLGYVLTPAPSAGLETDSAAIAGWCASNDRRLEQVVHDVDRRSADRPGLDYVLRQIGDGAAAGLVCVRLSDLTDSLPRLARLLRWFAGREVFLTALDYDIDTSTASGTTAMQALLAAGEWERERFAERSRRGMATGRPRPAVRDDHELRARIAAMLARGMSLQAIADTLNADRVPTLRGDSHWRPSSVQAAVGYKRPRDRGA